MKFTIYFLLATLIVSFARCVEEFPSNIDKCKYEDEECLVNAFNKYIKLVDEEGIPGLLPRMHTSFVEKQVVNMGSNALNTKVVFTNVTVGGMATARYDKIVGFKRDPKTISSIVVTGLCPQVSILGQYQASGKILLVPIAGKGEGEVKYYNVRFKVTLSTKTEERDGEEYLIIAKVHTIYGSDSNHYRFENMMNNKELSDGVNKLLNENQDIFNKEVMEPTATSFSKVVKRIVAPVFKRYPYRMFFLD